MTREAKLARRSDEQGDGSAGAASDTTSDAALLRQAAGGDAAAFRRLTERHIGPALGIARRLLRDDAEAEDVVQEAILRLWRSAGSLEIGEAGVRPWLRRVVSNLAIDRFRATSRTDVVEQVPEQEQRADQLDALTARETTARVDQALKALPERQRLALTLFHYEGLSQTEIGAQMGISDEAVESLLSRARKTLRTQLRTEWQELLHKGGD